MVNIINATHHRSSAAVDFVLFHILVYVRKTVVRQMQVESEWCLYHEG